MSNSLAPVGIVASIASTLACPGISCPTRHAMATLVPAASGTLRLVHGTGNLTIANIANSGGDVAVQLDAAHWLRKASGGAQTASWRELEVAMAAACYFNKSALVSVLLTRSAISLSTMADVFLAAIAKGLSEEDRGSVKAALHYFATFVRSVRSASPADFTIDAPGEFRDLDAWPPAVPLPLSLAWTEALTVAMCVDSDGDGAVLAHMIEFMVHRYSPSGRTGPYFLECCNELFEATNHLTPNLGAKLPRMQAMCVKAFVESSVIDTRLLICHEAEDVAEVVVSLSRGDALSQRFREAWVLAYPNLYALLTASCLAREAWMHSVRLLGVQPTHELLAGLDARIGSLLGTFDTEPDLSGEGALVATRVAQMDRLLTSVSQGSRTTASLETMEGASTDDPIGTSELFAKSDVKAFVSDMETLHTSPIVAYRVAKRMAAHSCALGLQFLQGVPIKHKLLDKFKMCRDKAVVIEAFRRHICVDKDNQIRPDWFSKLDDPVKMTCVIPEMLINGTFVKEGRFAFNPWLHLVSPMIKMIEGEHMVRPTLDAAASRDPLFFFSSEEMLRVGAGHLCTAFAFIGLPTSGDLSLASALNSLSTWASKIERLPDSLTTTRGQPLPMADTKAAMSNVLRRATVAGFQEFANDMAKLKNTPPSEAIRPGPFAPVSGTLNSQLANLGEMYEPLHQELRMLYALDAARAAHLDTSGMPPPFTSPFAYPLPPPPPSAIGYPPSTSPSYSDLGPSASQISSPHGQAAAAKQARERQQAGSVLQLEYGVARSELTQCGRGTLASTLRIEGAGVWFEGPKGFVWCSAKHAGSTPYDPSRSCLAAVLPDDVDKGLYCTGKPGCKHNLPGGYTKWFAHKVLSNEEITTKRARDDPGKGTRGAAKGRGRGRGKGERGGGRGKGLSLIHI